VVKAPPERDHDLASRQFLDLLDRLLAAGSTFAADLAADPGDGAVMLTFDDGTQDHRAVGEALAARGVPAVFFVSAGLVGSAGYLDEGELRELVAERHVIGSHGWSHRRLDLLPEADLAREIDSSRSKLEDIAGVPVTLFAPAGGIGIPSLPDRLGAAGYMASRSTRWGIHRQVEDRWRIAVVPVTRVTVDRGWVVAAATGRRLPIPMIAMSAVRAILRPRARSILRGWVHGRYRDAA
jgi:peptidoglycan/xylan/chitin deacetylase (PgdA/CDA1 family)